MVISEQAALDPYTIENFDQIFRQKRYDIVETDMLMLQDFMNFTNYMNTPETRTWISLTEDLYNQVPRHLLPAINEFY